MAEITSRNSAQELAPPYPASWIDRFVAWIERIPGSFWLIYLFSTLGIAVLTNAVFWIDGSMPIGSIDTFSTLFAPFVVYWLVLYQYLTGVGTRSLRVFRPLLDVEDSEITRINHKLSKLPRWIGLLSIPFGFGFAAAMDLSDPAPFGDVVPRTVLPLVFDIVFFGFLISTFFCLLIRSVRQLRMVRRLHSRATNINLLKLEPAHAFATLSSRTGIGIILVLVFATPLDTTPFESIWDITLTGITVLVAIAVFVSPVIGIRNQIEEAKQRALNETNDLLLTTSDRLHNLIRDDKYQSVEGTKHAFEALMRERDLIQKTSTWPWDLSTLRGFASALLLPIFLIIVSRLIERFF